MHSPIDLAERGVVLIDGEQRNHENPRTFKIPPEQERQGLRPGDNVKVGFALLAVSGRAKGERLWVQVVEVKAEPKRYVGVINNDPVLVALRDKEAIVFEPKHVLMIYMGDDAEWH